MKTRALLIWFIAIAVAACGRDVSPPQRLGFGPGPGTGTGFTLQGSGVFGPLPLPWNWTPSTAAATTTMSLAMADSADPTAAGNGFSYTATLTNTGGVSATFVSCAFTLDASLTYVSSSGAGWSCGASGSVVTCTVASITTGAAPAITVNVTAGNSSASITTSGSCSASNVTSNATASEGTTITRPVMTATLTDSADPVISGADSYSYTFGLSNAGVGGAGSINTISAAITLDASLTYVSASGTGWSCSFSSPTVTCTLATLGVGSANNVTVNVTTGTSGVSASSSVLVTAVNAANASASQGTTVQLVSKDATAGIYVPASSTEWTNFIARKGLSISVPDALFLCQEASGNLGPDPIGGFTLTASGTAASYAQTVTGWSRKAIKATDGATTGFASVEAGLPDVSVSSESTLAYVLMPSAAPGAVRNLILEGTTRAAAELTTTPVARARSNANTADGTSNPTGANTVRPVFLRHDRTNSITRVYTDQDKISATYSATTTGKKLGIFTNGGGAFAGGYLVVVSWSGAHAEMSDATVKALLQALGFTIPWS